ncbi:MAG: hypothetical protein HZB38_04570 [Planctomycetes bacterium]|nr:hypothetical protein [Planctomycetota bacterium]
MNMRFVLAVTLLVVASALATAQTPPTASAPASQPAAKTPIKAKVIEVNGDVKWAALEGQEWKPVKLNDEFGEQTKFLTGVRSSLKLQIGAEEPYTCMLIDSVGKTVLSEAYKTSDTKTVRIGVGYGRVRGGVAEGGLKSDFTIDSPVPTLSKRGTWGFSLYYERDTDAFEIGLTDFGLVEAMNKLTAEKRNVLPGQLVTEAMRRWLDQTQIFRNVSVADILGQGDLQIAFNRLENDGLGITQLGSGRAIVLNLSNANARDAFRQLLNRTLLTPPALTPQVSPLRSEGFFGTGRGDQLLEFVISSNDSLAKSGAAKPGNYRFRRDALESWMRANGGR